MRNLLALATVVALCLLGSVAPAAPTPDPQTGSANITPAGGADAFEQALRGWHLPTARAALGTMAPGPQRELRLGVLEVYEARYAEGQRRLSELLASGHLDDPGDIERAEHFAALARGAQEALGAAITLRSPDGRFEAVFADPKDQLLAPYLFDAMAVAYERLGDEIGVRPDHPIRFEFLDDPGKLALVTPLGIDNIFTTGTVGITKYRRIMMVTPRVMLRGYGWLDTAVHEYVHYVLTMRTDNAAPVWLQEGMAKLLETRWRLDESPPLDPPVAALLRDALAKDELVTLEQMHPSVAMLPTKEMAALAYAEAETMLGLLRERGGPAAITSLMDNLVRGIDARAAVAEAWGASFDEFMAEWKRVMAARTKRAKKGELGGPQFRDPDDPASDVDLSLAGDIFSHLGGGKARQHARLGVLLTLRGHKAAAVIEYEKARKADAVARRDPKLARRLGELLLELGDGDKAGPLLDLAAKAQPEDPNLAAAQGRAYRLRGEDELARQALARAVRVNPFIPSLHCDLAKLAQDETRRAQEQALCAE